MLVSIVKHSHEPSCFSEIYLIYLHRCLFKLLFFIFRSPELVIADMGCGEAKISQSVPNKVFSFDFVAVNEFVTVCDMAKVVVLLVYEIPACIFLLIICSK